MSNTRPTRAEVQRAYRDKLRGGPPREPEPCPSVAAARRHQRAGEEMCSGCRVVWREYRRPIQRANRARKRGDS